MDFSNLTDDQISWLEGKIKEAYDEGIYDSEATWLWTKEFVMVEKGTLKLAVRDNLRDYGV
jgi:hypothetical protein